jgi:Ribbon-helix-helix protein, copG family
MTTKRAQVGLHLDADVIEGLREMTTVSGVPMSEFMRRAVAQALAAYRDKGTVPQASTAPRRKRRH